MQRLLNLSEAAQIDARLHDNTLLQVCCTIWPERQEIITSVMARPEDIFCESVWLIDELVGIDANTDVTSLTGGLWTTVVTDIGYWANGVSLEDRFLIASTVFRLVATAFSLHWNSFYSETLRDALITVVDEKYKKWPSPLYLQEQQLRERQLEDILGAIINCSTILRDWVNDYIDNFGNNLTNEIDLALNPSKVFTTSKINKAKKEKKENNTRKDDRTKYSFILNIVDRKIRLLYRLLSEKDDKGKQLIDADMISHNDLKQVVGEDKEEYIKGLQHNNKDKIEAKDIIESLNIMLFQQVFLGQETDVRIIWRGDANELLYLIDKMNKYKVKDGEGFKLLLDRKKPGPKIWQLTRLRFMNGKERKVMDERTGKETTTNEPIEFDDDAFAKHNYPKDTTRLDYIIEQIAPERYMAIEEEIQNDFRGFSSHRKNNKKSVGELKDDGDFHDTNKKNKNE